MTQRRVREHREQRGLTPLLSRVRLMIDSTRQREFVGVVLFLLGGLTLLSLLHVTPNAVSVAWERVLRMLLGWGAFALPVFAIGAGAFLLRRGENIDTTIPWGRLFAGEILYAAALALLHLSTPARNAGALAGSGEGGGLIGWAISSSLSPIIGSTGTVMLLVLLGLTMLPAIAGLSTAHLRAWSESLEKRADQTRPAPAKRPSRAIVEPSAPPRIVPAPPLPKIGSVAPSAPAPTIAARQAPASMPAPATTAKQPPTSAPPSVAPAKQVPVSPAAPGARPVLGTKSTSRASAAPQTVLTPRHRPRRRGPALPTLALLDASSEAKYGETDANRKARIIEETLTNFGIPVKVVEINAGPTVTQFGLEPGFVERRGNDGVIRQRKVSVSRIASLQHDLELALAAAPIRIETPVPGRPIVGIEVPNESVSVVSLRGVMESDSFKRRKLPLKVSLGRDVSGLGITADLGAMPHLLIAGATGSGKSACINALIACLLFNNSPDDLRLIMIDPKRVELVNFNGIPHLLGPVVVNMEDVVPCLRWVVREMDNRFLLFAKEKVRNIDAFNEKTEKAGGDTMPYVVVLIDELADLMLAAPEETEKLLTRLAQMARATGIHLVIATQRPSVDVVTGLIKANFPSRISFAVTSSVDSRVVLDTPGAEKLLGRGDMLYMASDSSKLLRLQGCFVSEDELARLVHFWREKAITDMRDVPQEPPWKGFGEGREGADEALIEQATELLRQYARTSISFLQRKLEIGYPRAARLMDQLEERGVVGTDEGGGKSRVVLIRDADTKDSESEPFKRKR